MQNKVTMGEMMHSLERVGGKCLITNKYKDLILISVGKIKC